MPAAALTYNGLKEQVSAYLERGVTLASDPTVFEQIPFFISLTERRLARELKLLGTVNVVTTTLQASVAVVDKPDRWRQTVSMRVSVGGESHEIYPRSYEYARLYWPDQSVTDVPRFYADYDWRHWFIVPTPDEDYPVEILYNELPALLSDSNQTNYYTEFCPDMLLYGSLMEANPFLKNDAMMTVWQTLYDRAMASANGQDIGQMKDRGIDRKAN